MNTVETFNGKFGQFGGQYVAETLMPALLEIEKGFKDEWKKKSFHDELAYYLNNFVGRPTPLFYAQELTKRVGGAKIYLKREDLNHTGAHKINNTIGQVLLARKLSKKRVIAETGAGQHGVATATAASIFGLTCDIFMGVEDIQRQSENVKRMKLLGARVIPVASGTGTLKDAMNEALRNWTGTVEETFYVIGSVAGPHPYPMIVREFQRVIGDETKKQILALENRFPDTIVACVGGGSNSIGIFAPFISEPSVSLVGVEAGGLGLDSDQHAASINCGKIGVLHGSKSYVLQNKDGQIRNAHSISAGLDYPGVGPEHAALHQEKRVTYATATDEEAVKAFLELTRYQGIIPALETSHAIAHAMKIAAKMSTQQLIVVNLSGRGDKDMNSIEKFMADPEKD